MAPSDPRRGVAIDASPAPCDQASAILKAHANTPPLWELDIDQERAREREASRARARSSSAFPGADDPETSLALEEVDAGGVPARLYHPPNASGGALLWLHGGAFMLGGLDVVDPMARVLAVGSGSHVLSVDYRLAPEHRYPAAIDDAWTATRWAAARFDRIAVGGQSAGGNLAAGVALRARDHQLAVELQVLLVPVLDYAVDAPHYAEFAKRYAAFAGIADFGHTNHREMRFMWEAYVPDPTRRTEVDAAPIRARSHVGIAPAFIATAEHDILRDEAERYARRLRSAGVGVELLDYPGQVHGFVEHLDPESDGRDALSRAAAAVRAAFIAGAGADPQ